MIKFLHCGDLHLDAPFALRSPTEAERRRTELRGDLSSLMLYIRQQKVEICLISGDLFDGNAVTPETLALLEREFASCPDCRFFVSPGNHDPLTAGSPYRTMKLPANVHIFGSEKERVCLDDLGVDVYGFGFDGRNGGANPVLGYPRKDPSRINILCCHGDLEGGNASPYCPFTKEDLARSGFDYVALGHIHKGTDLQKEGEVFWAYPGCIRGRGFDETGYKGFLFGAMEKGNVAAKFIPVSNHRYEIAAVDVTGLTRTEALEKVRKTAITYGRETILRVILTGQVEEGLVILPGEISHSAEYPASVEIKDRTVLAPRFTDLEKSNTLKGVFYRLMAEKIEKGEIPSDALKYGLLALDDRNVTEELGEE